jgi:hypothetical protein
MLRLRSYRMKHRVLWEVIVKFSEERNVPSKAASSELKNMSHRESLQYPFASVPQIFTTPTSVDGM